MKNDMNKNWYSLSDLKPGAPKNIKFGITDRSGQQDTLYPERSPKKGTTVIWIPEHDAHIGIASYVDACKSQDAEKLAKLAELGIPTNLNFGYRPSDDLTSTYTVWKEKKPRAKKADSVKIMRAKFAAHYTDGTSFKVGDIVKIVFRKNYMGEDRNGHKIFENAYERPTEAELAEFKKSE